VQKRLPFYFSLLLSLLFATSCQQEELTQYSATYFGFETFISIKAINSGQEIIDRIGERLSTFSDLCDRFTDTDEKTIYDVNATNEPVEVPSDLAKCLQFALDMKEKCGAYFNPLIANLSDLWKKAIEDDNHTLPKDDDLTAAIEEMNKSTLEVKFDEEKQVYIVIRKGSAKVDMGAFAKGYALKFAKEMFEEAGVKRYIINAGNSSLLVGESSQFGSYKITPEVDGNHYFEVKNESVGTSGSSTQEFVKDGVAYTHIVNPLTGEAKVQDYPFVSIVGMDPGIDDVLSTVFYLLGPGEEAKNLADSFNVKYAFYDGKGSWESYGIELLSK